MKRTIAMTGGGTGGHLAIIRAVKEEIGDRDMIYIGSRTGQDRSWFGDDEGFLARYFLDTRGVVNQGFSGRIVSLFMMLKATAASISVFRKHKVSLVFSVGGYSAAPSAFAARILGIPLVIHEQNAVSGSLNRLMRGYSKAFISSYENGDPVIPYPVSKVFFNKSRKRKNVKTLIFLGGSQGAQAINSLALSIAPLLAEKNISIIHQAGEKNIEDIKKRYEKLNIKAEVFGFSRKLPELMASADMAVSRAGASTLWELAANGLPALFIPYPYAAGDHQYYNALALEKAGAAWIMRENEIDKERLIGIIESGDLEQRSVAMMSAVESDGAAKIAILLKEYS